MCSNVCKFFHEIKKNKLYQIILALVVSLVITLLVISFLVSYILVYSIGPQKCPKCEAVVV